MHFVFEDGGLHMSDGLARKKLLHDHEGFVIKGSETGSRGALSIFLQTVSRSLFLTLWQRRIAHSIEFPSPAKLGDFTYQRPISAGKMLNNLKENRPSETTAGKIFEHFKESAHKSRNNLNNVQFSWIRLSGIKLNRLIVSKLNDN